MAEQTFKRGEAFDPHKPLVVHGSQLFLLEDIYPEIVQVAQLNPGWEGKRFIIFPTQPANVRLLETLAATKPSGRTKNHPHSILDGKKLVAVVVHQTGAYRAYDPLYTWRLET